MIYRFGFKYCGWIGLAEDNVKNNCGFAAQNKVELGELDSHHFGFCEGIRMKGCSKER
jgi:hypothetical protein